jgi:hypothetical protein
MRFALVTVLLLAANPVRAGTAPDEAALMLIGGANLGVAHHDGNGFLLGAELSMPYARLTETAGNPNNTALWSLPIGDLFSMFWAGPYVDVTRDFETDATRMSFGPELGVGVIGVDGGFLHQFGDTPRSGWTVRPVLTIALVSLYWRHGAFTDDLPDASFDEFGVLLKFGRPLWLSKPR